jgi:signal transduction histidine kinase
MIIERLKNGLEYTKDNHQLWYTIAVAVVIFSSFFFVVNKFVTIAEDSAERLVNVRVGSIQDAFVVFAKDDMNAPLTLQEKIKAISSSNATIEEFDVIKFIAGSPIVFASLEEEQIGEEAVLNPTILSIVKADPSNSFTVEERSGSERFFRTARAITNDEKEVVGLVITRQSLSEADKQIDLALQNGMFVFLLIILVLMFLFFRFARIIDYATLYKKLKGVDQLKDDFIAMASHELRSPLATIRGYIELIRDFKNLSKEQDEYAHRVELSAANLNDLVADMLDVSRITQGRMKFENVDFNVEEVVSDVVESFKDMAQKKGLELKKEGLKEIVLHLDKSKVNRVLVNLVSNSIKYTKKGSVTVSIKELSDRVEIRVTDTGIGISKEDQEKLFERFFRVKSAETNSIQGTGLGLWLSREIIRKQNGEIHVESIKGVGTHFVVTLPFVRKDRV